MTDTVELRRLHLSPCNVRKTDTEAFISGFADDIAAHGVLQSLLVRPSAEYGVDSFEVIAGGRRYRALMQLVDRATITLDQPVPVVVHHVDDEAAREISFSENLQHEPMNCVDELEAWAAMVETGTGDYVERLRRCARRFGKTVLEVQQRLRLAALAPDVLDALRVGTIGIEAARAYASFADQDLQLQVFHAEGRRFGTRQHEPRAIRDALQCKTYPSNIRQALYVGLIVYRGRGGRVEVQSDLFASADAGGERLLDPRLVDDLAREKAEGELDAVVARDGFAAGVLVQAFVSLPARPRQPAGHYHMTAWGSLTKRQLKTATGIYNLKADGSGLEAIGIFMPTAADTKTATDAATPAGRETETQRLGRIRRENIRWQAAQLAIRNRVPAESSYRVDQNEWLRGIVERDGRLFVPVLIEVGAAEIEALSAEAEREVDAAETMGEAA